MPSETLTLTCVCCNGYPLEACVHESRRVAVCPRCGGLWCDAAQWDPQQLGALPTADATPVAEPTLVNEVVFDSAPRNCGKCRVRMTRMQVFEVIGLWLERCGTCGGVWFDKGEWEKLAALQTWKCQLPTLDRPTNWGEWFLQMFLRLPIEFNIKPRRTPWMTLAIIAVCTLINLLAMSPALRDSIYQFAAEGTALFQVDQSYTLLTYQFLHDGWIHLALNMYFLYVLGDNVEDVLGPGWFLAFYLACGVAAAVTQFAVVDALDLTPMYLVGASGSIAGIIAAYLVLFRRSQLTFMFFFWQRKLPAKVWITIWLLSQIAAGYLDPDGQLTGVAVWAHIGGFAAGVILILPFRRRLVARHTLLDLLDRRQLRRPLPIPALEVVPQPPTVGSS